MKPKSAIKSDVITLNSDRRTKKPVPVLLRVFRVLFNTLGRIAPKTAARAAFQLWIHPPRFAMPDSESNFRQIAQQTQFRFRDTTIACYQWLPEPPHDRNETVLLVHGWSGRGTQLGPFAGPLTQSGYRVISFDAPAHGNSSGSTTNLYEIADVILELEQRYGRFDAVITHSFGGPCIASAMKHGLNTHVVVNISPPSTVCGLVDKFCETLHVPGTVKTSLIRNIEHRFGQTIWDETSMEKTVRKFSLPVLVVHDADDSDVPSREGRAIASAWQNADYIETHGLGHRRILKDESTINTVVRFIQAQLSSDNEYQHRAEAT